MLNSSNTNINLGTTTNLDTTSTTINSNNNLEPGYLFKPTFHNTVNTSHDFANINTSLEKPGLASKLDSSLLMDIKFQAAANEASTGCETSGGGKPKASPKKAGMKRKKDDEGENNEKKKPKASNQRRNIK